MMKKLSYVAACFAASMVLVSCGGGGDISGDLSEFSISPEEYNLKLGPGADCRSASTLQPIVVTIIGGQAPFRIINSAPGALLIDKTEATGKDPQFRVSYSPNADVCADPAVITVLDYYSRAVSFEYKVEVEKAEEEPAQ